MNFNHVALCLALGIVITVPFIAFLISMYEFFLFKTDPQNPYRRFCKKCGQRQEEYGLHAHDPRGWWEVMGQIKDTDCSCHTFAA